MDDALPLDNNLDLILGQSEQPDCLNQFQALVHQRSRVDGDLGAHIPVGMTQRVLLGLAPQLPGGHTKERPAGSGEQDLLQPFGGMLILKTLEDGGVLAVHRQQMNAMLFDGVGDQVTAGDKAFLVGQGQVVAALNGSKGGRQARNAHHRVEHHIGAFHGGQFPQPLGAAKQPGRSGGSRQGGVQPVTGVRVDHGDVPGMELGNLLQQELHAGIGGKAKDFIAVHTGNVQALGPDGAGGAQQSDGFRHGFFHIPFLLDKVEKVPYHNGDKRRNEHHAVKAVQNAAMAREDGSVVLDARLTFDR